MLDSFISLNLHILFHQVLLTSSPKYVWIWGSPPFLCKATNYSTTLCRLGWLCPPNWSRQFYFWFFPLYSLSGSHSHLFKLQTRLCHHLLEPLKAFDYTLYYISQGPMWFLPIDLWTFSSGPGRAIWVSMQRLQKQALFSLTAEAVQFLFTYACLLCAVVHFATF